MLQNSSQVRVLSPSKVDEGKGEKLTKPWMPTLWHGMDFFAWLRLLRKNRFAIDWNQAPTAVMVTLFSVGNTLLRGVQYLIFDRQIRATKVQTPIFIIGHYRTGTTLLHELLSLDERFTYPTTYECFSPNHFLITESIVSKYLGFMIPRRRLQDNMRQGWERPQEDESALLNLGAPTPYARCAFPNQPNPYPGSDDLDGLTERERRNWMRTLDYFLKQVTYLRPKPIVLKSPLHTCRVQHLLEMFPEARFIYTVRDPRDVFPSTLKLWKVVYQNQAFQAPHCDGLEEWVLSVFNQMHESAERARSIVPEKQFTQMRYEDLVANPISELQRVYAHLGLGELGSAAESIEQYFDRHRSYKKNQHLLSDEQREEVTRSTRAYLDQHGYPST